MQTESAGRVAQEAGNAEAHVLGVAQSLQKQGGQIVKTIVVKNKLVNLIVK